MPEEDSELLADYLPEEKLAALLGKTTRTLRSWRKKRAGPPFVRLGRDIFYHVPSSKKWLEKQIQLPVRGK